LLSQIDAIQYGYYDAYSWGRFLIGLIPFPFLWLIRKRKRSKKLLVRVGIGGSCLVTGAYILFVAYTGISWFVALASFVGSFLIALSIYLIIFYKSGD
jgi:apolipoprotein N-acyltransferase